jgi:hypothetical protein
MKTSAKVLKVSESGDSIFVNVKKHQFDTKGMVGYCANPEKQYKVGDIIPDFPMPVGIEHRTRPSYKDEAGQVVEEALFATKAGEPLSFLVF